jgi:hypothetical protein
LPSIGHRVHRVAELLPWNLAETLTTGLLLAA